MSGAGAANNSWTILTSEETVAETLRPLAEGTKQHEESHTSATGPGEKNQPPNSAESAEERLPEESYRVSEDQNADSNSNPPSVDASGTLDHGDVESKTEAPTRSSSDPDSSSDSYTLLTPSLDGPPVSLLSTETLGGAEFSPAEEELRLEETLHLQNKEEPHQEGQQSGIGERTEEGESVERRRKSLLEQIGRKEEEEEEVEEEFQVPQRENDGVFSLNKCILAALILLGLGTVFFSGVFMDFDEEGEYTTRELKDTEAPGEQEWLSPEVAPGLDHNSSELLNKLAEGNQQISTLQAQLQAQKEELKVAKEQAAEGEEQRLLWEEVEKENSRLKTEIASLPVLQKENDRMKKELDSVPALQKELETLRSTVTNLKLSPASDADQAAIKHSTSPPSDQTEDGRQDSVGPPGKQPWKTWGDQKQKKEPNKVKYEINDKKQQKEKDKSVRKEGDGKELKKGDKMEWKKGKHEHGKLEKDKDKPGKQKRQSDEASPWKQKELKKEKGGRGNDGRPLEDKEGRKKLKEDRDWKKGSFEKVHEHKEWTGKEKGEWRGGKHRDEKLKGEMEWKKGKHGGKEKQERKDWKEKGDKKDPEWKDKIGKEGKGKGERKQWDNSKSHGKERTATDERKQWKENERKSKNGKEEKKFKRKDKTSEQFKIEGMKLKEKKHNVDWEKDQSHSLKKKNDEHEFPGNHGHKEEHLYGERKPHHTHPNPSIGQPEYWLQQRQRLQHDPKPPQHCDTLETCAQAEGLLPVPSSEFESVLQTYLTKIEEAGVDGSKTSELRKIALEFFKDGMFVHNQRSFQDFVDDLADILEDMVEDGDAEDSDLEDEMEGFEKEVLKMFSLPGGREKEKRIKGEWRKENRQERG
ncbi:PREDICTED: pre-B-cell leukemia transcription factor-interacting protein 1 isoform X2 [Poecilia mexicana]|uniref:pre-B-cell leukemia transcription factor-interacting protein 1 isoform X2 n=1 Tax=Poecilia mexicana TaxID=48701 RepID=UPI00072E65FD|nr:PREDICTED: pre-B-cell leukemia transcription factor-interacting protein 1 isoform X2 [Poecilia mexicana]